MNVKKLVIAGLFACLTGNFIIPAAFASGWKPWPDSTSRTAPVEIVKDNRIISMLDSLARLTFNIFPENYDICGNQNKYNFPPDHIPVYSDSVIIDRMKQLNSGSPFNYIFNPQVRLYIDLYGYKRRQLTQKIMGLSKIYFPLFEEMLDRYNMPLELKYLAVIESALNPTARSPVGAKGLWQFMYHTGKLYDLKVTSFTDDRADPYKATEAACRHMQDLYCIYQDWSLVLAAYNSGAGNVNKAIRRAGGVINYWAIQRFLPRETRDYVPAFIAASYVMHYSAEYNLYPVDPGITAADIDTVTVKKVLSFEQISEMFKIPMENLRFLNPAYTKDIIPAAVDNNYFLRLPRPYVADFINNEDALYAYRTQRMQEREKLMSLAQDLNSRSTMHVVRKGETLAKIAKKYRCTIADLKRWNGIRSNYVKARTELIVYQPSVNKAKEEAITQAQDQDFDVQAPVAKVKSPANLATVPVDTNDYKALYPELFAKKAKSDDFRKKTEEGVIYHTVRQGDTLWSIAQQYEGVSVEKIKQLNNISNAKKIKPGQKIKILIGG